MQITSHSYASRITHSVTYTHRSTKRVIAIMATVVGQAHNNLSLPPPGCSSHNTRAGTHSHISGEAALAWGCSSHNTLGWDPCPH